MSQSGDQVKILNNENLLNELSECTGTDKEVYLSKEVATFEVTVLDKEKKYYKFKWQVEKYKGESTLNDCWLTTAVSQPISMGSSI